MGRAPRRNAALALGMAALIVTGGAETITERMKRVKAEYKAAQEAGQGKEWEQKQGLTKPIADKSDILTLIKQAELSPIVAHLKTTNGAQIDKADRMQNGVMHAAAKIMRDDPSHSIAKALLEYNPPLNVRNPASLPADAAGMCSHPRAARCPQAKNGRDQTPLAIAVQYGNTGLVKILIDAGASVSAAPNRFGWSLMDAVGFYNVYSEDQRHVIPQLLAAKGLKVANLHQAAGVGDVEMLKRFLSMGVSPNVTKSEDDRPIHWAARSGYADAVTVLLEAGADPSQPDNGDDRPVYLAARYGHVDAGVALIDAGGEHTIGEAAALGHTAEVLRMIESGVSPDEKRVTRSREPPLHRAAQWDHTETVEALLSAGASLHETDKFGESALEWAMRASPRGFSTIAVEAAALLIEKGVRGITKVCAFAESADEMALVERYFTLRAEAEAAQPPEAAAVPKEGGEGEEGEGEEEKELTLAEELEKCEERREGRLSIAGDPPIEMDRLRAIIGKVSRSTRKVRARPCLLCGAGRDRWSAASVVQDGTSPSPPPSRPAIIHKKPRSDDTREEL